MVIRRRLRAILTTLGLYVGAGLFIGYFGVNAYTGNHGLRAKQEMDRQYASLNEELDRLRLDRLEWQRRVSLLKSESIDPDTLDERARAMLGYLERRELTYILKQP
jgi:cell division protein FtsB